MKRILGDLGDLTIAVDHQARSDANRIEADAKKKTAQIRAEAQKQAEARRQEILAEARDRVADMRRERDVSHEREQHRALLEARHELLDQVWRQAEDRIDALTDDPEAYADALRRLTLQAVDIMGAGRWVLTVGKQGHALLDEDRLQSWGRQAREKIDGEVELVCDSGPDEEMPGGVIIGDEDGRRRVDARFSTRLEMAREEICGDILKILVQG